MSESPTHAAQVRPHRIRNDFSRNILPGSKSQSWASSITRGTCKSMLHEITHARTNNESLNCTCRQADFIHNISGMIDTSIPVNPGQAASCQGTWKSKQHDEVTDAHKQRSLNCKSHIYSHAAQIHPSPNYFIMRAQIMKVSTVPARSPTSSIIYPA